MFRFALQMSGKTEIAEEVTQDVFMVVMSAPKQFDPERGSAGAYLYGIARNLVLRCLEREKPYLTVLDDPGHEYSGRLAGDQDIAGELAHERANRIAAQGGAGAAAGVSRSSGVVRSA